MSSNLLPEPENGSLQGGDLREYGAGRERDLRRQLSRALETINSLRALVDRDPLTGALNRRGFSYELEHAVSDTERSGRPYALVVLDLDGFKNVNDRRGHKFGDTVLVEVVKRLKEIVRATDHVSRIGGDEFAVLLSNCTAPAAKVRVRSMRNAIAAACAELGIGELCRGASFGVATVASPDIDLADMAMYREKRRKRKNT